MNFSNALEQIKWGMPMSRSAWGNPAVYVFRMLPPDTDQLAQRTADGHIVLWTPAPADIMATDWVAVPRIS